MTITTYEPHRDIIGQNHRNNLGATQSKHTNITKTAQKTTQEALRNKRHNESTITTQEQRHEHRNNDKEQHRNNTRTYNSNKGTTSELHREQHKHNTITTQEPHRKTKKTTQ